MDPLHEEALIRAGEQLDGLTETRAAQDRLENSAERVTAFLALYQRYSAETLRSMARDTLASADTAIEAERNSRRRADELTSLQEESGDLQAQAKQLADELTEIDHTLTAIQAREIFKTADDLVQRNKAEAALATAADQALAAANRVRAHHRRAVADADRVLAEIREACGVQIFGRGV